MAKRAAQAHAAAVTEHIKALPYPLSQKLALLDAVIQAAKQNAEDSSF